MGCICSKKQQPQQLYYDFAGSSSNVFAYPRKKNRRTKRRPTIVMSQYYNDTVNMMPQYPGHMPFFHRISGIQNGMVHCDPGVMHFGSGGVEKAFCRVVATFDYTARDPNELDMKEGDQLDVFGDPQRNWLRVCVVNRPRYVGYVPSSHVALANTIEAQPWYFSHTPRSDAERVLLTNKNSYGAFLVRCCEIEDANHALSVRMGKRVRHFLIRGTAGKGFCVTKKQKFKSIQSLIDHYSSKEDNPLPQLQKPCKKLEAPPTIGLTHKLEGKWEVPRHLLRFTRKLGEGNYGQVHEALFSEVLKVAVKTLKKKNLKGNEFMDEVEVMQKLLHPKVVQLHGISTLEDPFYIVTELLPYGDLLTYLRKGKGKHLSEKNLIDIATQVATGMAYLEANNFVHKDLAARNLLVGEEHICKISDFGFARLTKGGFAIHEAGSDQKIPLKWSAPECMKRKVFSTKSDVWAFGIVLVEIIEKGMVPYPGLNNSEVYKKVTKGYVMPHSIMQHCPSSLYKIMKQCWNKKPSKRPTFLSLVSTLERFYDK